MKIGDAPTQADFHEAISARSDRWYSACLKITRNPDMAADAVQDALLNAWNKRHQFEQTARLDLDSPHSDQRSMAVGGRHAASL
jgi:DNA-directed RNA polymerase specialized sigma24 family protein